MNFYKKIAEIQMKTVSNVTRRSISSSKQKMMNENPFGKYEIVTPWPISSLPNETPSHINKPSYYKSANSLETVENVEIKNKDQIELMKRSCQLAKSILNSMHKFVKPDVTTDVLDRTAHRMIIEAGAYPSPLFYRNFPKSICTSVNNIACHGIPDTRPLASGDIINIDVTVYLNGYHGDCSTMFLVEDVDAEGRRLVNATHDCLNAAVNICKPNERFSSIGALIEELADSMGYSVIPVFAGHGIGHYFHGPPDIFHIGNDLPGVMKPGMTFTIEPVLSQGSCDVNILDDGWTAATVDGSRTAQVEHTILITDHGCQVLT